MQGSGAGRLRDPRVPRIPQVAVLACWALGALVFVHSGAANMYLESRRVGSVLIARVRDDGQGFDTGRPPQGLEYMRRRAGEVGADLDVISTQGRGTSVQVRFRKRENAPNP